MAAKPIATQDAKINVAIRVRPLNDREKKSHKVPSWKVDASLGAISQLDATGNIKESFSYDHVFDEECTTDLTEANPGWSICSGQFCVYDQVVPNSYMTALPRRWCNR